MKNLMIALIFAPLFASSQIEFTNSVNSNTLGKAKFGGSLVAEISYSVNNNDTLYNFKFKNQQYEKITDYKNVSFSGQNNTLNDFFSVLMSFFSNENKKNKDYKVNFTLGSDNVTATNYRQLGSTYVSIQSQNGLVILTEKNVKQMFGRD